MTTDALYLPAIDAGMLGIGGTVAQPAPVAVIEPKTTDLAKLDLTTVALSQYGDWRASLKATKDNLSTLVLDLSTPAKIKEARTLRQRMIGDPLAAARKVAAGIKSKMAQTSKAVGAELEAIETAYTEADALILPKIEAREQELEREREENARLERERVARHQSAIARIRAYAVKAAEPGMTSERIAAGIAQVEAMTFTAEAWEEYAVPAANAQCETIQAMKALRDKALAAEAAAAEAERVRQENERRAAELAEQQRQLAEQRAAIERERAELEAARALQAQQNNEAAAKALVMGPAVASGAASPEHTPQGANRDASAGQSHVAEGSASPTGRGADGPTACGAAPVSHPGPVTMAEPPAPPSDEKPTLKLGEINDWLAPVLKVDAAGLEALGFVAHRERGAALYRPSDKERIRLALIEHLEGLK